MISKYFHVVFMLIAISSVTYGWENIALKERMTTEELEHEGLQIFYSINTAIELTVITFVICHLISCFPKMTTADYKIIGFTFLFAILIAVMVLSYIHKKVRKND